MEKKDYIGLFETKEVKDKNQEDIKKFFSSRNGITGT